MKPGQSAEVELDTYPDRPFKATVEGIGAGTGGEFSLLPAQNATGNWVKVTQRIPVRLKLDHRRQGPALRTGMSATVKVDTAANTPSPACSGPRSPRNNGRATDSPPSSGEPPQSQGRVRLPCDRRGLTTLSPPPSQKWPHRGLITVAIMLAR